MIGSRQRLGIPGLVVVLMAAGLMAFLLSASPSSDRSSSPPVGVSDVAAEPTLRGTPGPSDPAVDNPPPVVAVEGADAPSTGDAPPGQTSVRGVVLDARGRPAGGAYMFGSFRTSMPGRRPGRLFGKAAEDGTFGMRFPPGAHDMAVFAQRTVDAPPPMARCESAILRPAPGVTENVVLSLAAHEAEIDGTALKPDGAPLECGRVHMAQLDGPGRARLDIELDRTGGAFRFAGLAPGRYLLTYHPPAQSEWGIRHIVVDAPAKDVVIACRRWVRLEGCMEGEFSPDTKVLWRVPADWGAHWTSVVGDDGIFSVAYAVPEDGFLFFRDAENGRYALLRDIQPPYDDLRVRLLPGVEIGGTVRPAADPRLTYREVVLTCGDIVVEADVRPDGTFLARGLPPGTYALGWYDDRGAGRLGDPPVPTGTTNLVIHWPGD